MKVALLIAFLGHVLCAVCDCLLIFNKKKRIDFKCIGSQEQMEKEFDGMPIKNPLLSMLLGVLAIIMFGIGYLTLSSWVYGYNKICGALMFCGTAVFFAAGTAHHVFFGSIEWFYIKLGRTAEAREAVLDFLKKTISTMFACYLGWGLFLIPLMVAILTGALPLPWWTCFVNSLPIMLVLSAAKVPGFGNIAGALMMLGLLIIL